MTGVELVVTRGAPASGKSTWALQWIAEKPDERVRANRDMLREAIYARPAPLTRDEETAVSVAQRAAVSALLLAGKSVVVDDTHIRTEWVRNWNTLAVELGVAFSVNETFRDVPVEVCVERDASRAAGGGRAVGRDAVEAMHRRLRSSPVYVAPAADEPYVYTPDDRLPQAWLFDMDGTLALMQGRGPFDWHRVGEDACVEAVAQLVSTLNAAGYFIVIVSGRDEVCRSETEAWLLRHSIMFAELLMRPAGDVRKDAIVKKEILRDQIASAYCVRGVFDDRDQVVAMWRSAGLLCCQVAPGAF